MKWIVISLACIPWFTVIAQQKSAPASSLLWEIKSKDQPKPSYLFGTFHMLCKEEFAVTGVLAEKIAGSVQLFEELKMDDPSLQMQLMQKMIMKDKTLQSFYTPEEWKKMSEAFVRITGTPLTLLNNVKPFTSLSMLIMKSIDCQNSVSPEQELVKTATAAGKPVFGLETVEDQVNALEREPLDSQAVSLRKILLNFDSTKNMMQDMKKNYQLKDADSLYRYMKRMGVDNAFERALLVERNQRWIPKITEAMKKGQTFFAVGAGHLGGESGVIALLRKKGYTVSPVSF
jgi:uncharacterized protein YbaP (TraB family)